MSLFDRDGQPIDSKRFAQLLENPEYRSVACDELADGRWVSTVWLGLDHGFGQRPRPTIFETMVFAADGSTLLCQRYATIAEARRGHVDVLDQMRRGSR